ncbi:hypothetical protein ACFWOG_27845 [Kitasatospora sp. NPDC058406]|uniref:hypothetical protein n=1 Tax=Kitasatospora sp. NPDC058406 TaxID=3346483 RepID=UPI003645FFBC
MLLALHYHASANLADACRVLLDQLRPTARAWLNVPGVDRDDPWARNAFCQRVYRSFDRVTTAWTALRLVGQAVEGAPGVLDDARAAQVGERGAHAVRAGSRPGADRTDS